MPSTVQAGKKVLVVAPPGTKYLTDRGVCVPAPYLHPEASALQEVVVSSGSGRRPHIKFQSLKGIYYSDVPLANLIPLEAPRYILRRHHRQHPQPYWILLRRFADA